MRRLSRGSPKEDFRRDRPSGQREFNSPNGGETSAHCKEHYTKIVKRREHTSGRGIFEGKASRMRTRRTLGVEAKAPKAPDVETNVLKVEANAGEVGIYGPVARMPMLTKVLQRSFKGRCSTDRQGKQRKDVEKRKPRAQESGHRLSTGRGLGTVLAQSARKFQPHTAKYRCGDPAVEPRPTRHRRRRTRPPSASDSERRCSIIVAYDAEGTSKKYMQVNYLGLKICSLGLKICKHEQFFGISSV
ncbi:hypothetical protein B0H16DRAFT_1475705 [Mycena metata]|uniref:Uncharacterized protein n=1 Tax=Mycena metata TaxID=1033252 RepID=A0AAD7MIE3_9AGAR|nr:hypothetical protein B0H16DRAFT_1475705 [Mycena metata]